MTFHLGSRANEWNEIAMRDRSRFNGVKWDHWERLSCELMASITASELRVLVAITARTVRFKKFAEAISLAEFSTGLRVDRELLVDDEGRPYFAGCNIAKADTVLAAIKGLVEKKLITRWSFSPRRWSSVYMPFSEQWLAGKLVHLRGAIPSSYENWVTGELLLVRGHGKSRVIAVTDDAMALHPVNDYGEDRGEAYAIDAVDGVFEVHRFTIDDVIESRGNTF